MAADSSMGFHQGATASFYNHHMLSFQSNGDLSSSGGGTAGMVMSPRVMSTNSGGGGLMGGPNGGAGLFPSPNTGVVGNMPVVSPSRSSSRDFFHGVAAAPKYKFVTGSPTDWTEHELAILKEGLIRYAHEPNIMKYIKIAAMLPTRTIRDVALRCWWTTGKEKRKKPDDFYSGKKIRDMKDKMLACNPVATFQMAPSDNVMPFSISVHHPSQHCRVAREAVPVLDSGTQHLLEENNQLLSQIAANIAIFKMEENMDLFVRTNNNIRTILNRMSETPGIMGQMPPLPVPVNEDHLNSLLQLDRMVASYGVPHNLPTKQEPRS